MIKVNSSDIKKVKIFKYFNEIIYSILFYLKSILTDTVKFTDYSFAYNRYNNTYIILR